MLGWYCIVSRPQQEARAALELTNQGFTVFLPKLDGKPMFPRYLFAAFDRDRDNWGTIRSTRGCSDLIRFNGIPAQVPNYAMSQIMAYKPPEKPIDGKIEFTKGQVVRIESGVLAGLEGLFQADVRGRTACLLEILGKRVEVPRDTVRAA